MMRTLLRCHILPAFCFRRWNLRQIVRVGLSLTYAPSISATFPGTALTIGAAAKELMVAGLIVAYSDESLPLAYIPKFSHFQAINGREAQSKLPAPPRVVTRQVVSARDGTGEDAHAA